VTKAPRLTTLRPRVEMAPQRLAPRERQVDPYYSSVEHRAWRTAVYRQAGWRCEAMDNGVRCEASAARGDRMFADHTVERRDGGADQGEGKCLCGSHHSTKTTSSETSGWLGAGKGMAVKNAIKSSSYGTTVLLSEGFHAQLFEIQV
jgi:5-methylcytosine-specific restriction protein A